jgi:DNA-binding SARP family transcriptional activator
MSLSVAYARVTDRVHLTLISEFSCRIAGETVEIPDSSARVLAYVALHGAAVNRREAAGVLWPNVSDERAGGNLRSALWRVRSLGADIVMCDKSYLRFASDVIVDVDELSAWAHRLVAGQAQPSDLRVPEPFSEMDLLPGWYDDWVLFARERLRQRVLHALEALSGMLVGAGRAAEAIDAALLAVAIEPLRESALRVLIEAHLHERNYVEARRVFSEYSRLVQVELGSRPSPELAALLR